MSLTNLTIDDIFQSTPIGTIKRSVTDNLYGINNMQIRQPIPSNKDMYGFTFFVRPQLNLQNNNIRNVREFYSLLNTSDVSIHRYVRCMLDPRLMAGYGFDTASVPPMNCPLLDNMNPFISPYTNNLISMSGWPDKVTNYFTSKRGLKGEEYSLVDSSNRIYNSFDLDATFTNNIGNPIAYMNSIWNDYPTFCFEGKLMPYPDFIVENELDYNTRIYRLVLDSQRRYVTKIAATGACFPVTDPQGVFFNFNTDTPLNLQTKEFSIRFHCNGAMYNDDILVHEFNETMSIFNPYMRDEARDSFMVKIPRPLRMFFKNRGYPRINLTTFELEWWLPRDTFANRIVQIGKNGLPVSQYVNTSTSTINEFEGD